LLHVLGRSAKADAFGRSFAVLSMQVSTAGLGLRHSRLAFGRILEESRDVVAEGEEKLDSCTGEQSKCCFICTVILGSCGDMPFVSWVVGSVVAAALAQVQNSCNFYAACGCGTEYRCGALPGETCGDMLEAMARIASSQPNEAMARIAPRNTMVTMVNNKISLVQS
jgi:hypothetical protein